jgi:LmbE family N-acetylglucosaminyl deacetylase
VKTVNLVVVAHPDDEILGFGATGAKLVRNGEIVQPVILSGNVQVRSQRPSDVELLEDMANANKIVGFEFPILGEFPNIKMNTVPHLELVQFIERYVEEFQPRRIFTHHSSDVNDDHQQVSRACLAAFRLFQRRADIAAPESIYFMEILSATDWSVDPAAPAFRPDTFVEIADTLDVKIDALKCYRNVMREYPHPRSEITLRALAAVRGSQSGYDHAESFQTVFRRGIT